MRNAADDAIAKRRAELRRLQQQRGISERLSQAASAASNHRGGSMMMRSAVTNNNHSLSRFGTASMTSSSGGGGSAPLTTTARRLDESYKNNNAATANNTTAEVSYNGPPPPQTLTNANITTSPAASIPAMAVKRTSEIFPPKRGSSTASVRLQNQNINSRNIAPPTMTTMPSNMTRGATTNNDSQQYQQQHHHHHQGPPPIQQGATKPPPKQQSPLLNSIQSTTSSTNGISKSVKSSPFGQARVTKVIPALSLSGTNSSVGGGGGVKSLVPPLNMLDPPPLLDEADVKSHGGVGDDGVSTSTASAVTVKKVPMKSVGGIQPLPPIKSSGDVVTKANVKMTTPRLTSDEQEKEGEGINSGQSTPIHTNHKEESPRDAVAAADNGSNAVGNDGSKSKDASLEANIELIEQTRKALMEQNVDSTKSTAATTANDDVIPKSKEDEEVENHQPPQSKKEQEITHETMKDSNTTNGKNTNLSRLKMDLERSEKEKLDALEQVAKLKSLLEASGVGSNGETASSSLDQMSTIDTPRRVTTPRSGGGGGFGGITTPRGGNTPNRFTPSRSRAGVPPLAWGTPRSGNSRAGSRTGSPEHGHHHYGMMSGTPRVRASPLPKQLNRVISDTKLNKKGGEEGDEDATTTPQEEHVEEEFLAAAARSIPNEYGTPLASYFVRRPHVTDDSLEKNETDELAKVAIDLWGNKCTHLSSSDEYKKHASVFKPESLEVVACIEADGSVFTLTGECNARHGKVSTMFDEDDANIVENEYDWSVFDNVEEMDRALGRVSYIDEEGNEREYWLGKKRQLYLYTILFLCFCISHLINESIIRIGTDSIYEEALTTRESYCTSMISAAFTLKEVRGPLAQKREQPASWNQTMQSQPTQMQSFAPPKSTLNGGVNMSHPPLNQQNVPQSNANVPQNQSQKSEPIAKVEMPTNPVKKEPLTSETAPKASSSKEETKQKQSPPPEEYEPSDSALTVMVVALFSLFFKLSWLVIKTPFRIASMILTFWIMLIAVRVLCLIFADDNGAWDIGAGVEYEYNMPGIY